MFRSDIGTGNERFSNLPQLSVEVGGINGPRLKSELSRGGVYVSSWASELLDSLQRAEKQEQVSTVELRLRDVGIRDYISGPDAYDKVVKAIKKEGLGLLPQLTAAETALKHAGFIGEGEWVDFLSKPMAGRSGSQRVFVLYRFGGELKLYGNRIDDEWDPDNLVVARLR